MSLSFHLTSTPLESRSSGTYYTAYESPRADNLTIDPHQAQACLSQLENFYSKNDNSPLVNEHLSQKGKPSLTSVEDSPPVDTRSFLRKKISSLVLESLKKERKWPYYKPSFRPIKLGKNPLKQILKRVRKHPKTPIETFIPMIDLVAQGMKNNERFWKYEGCFRLSGNENTVQNHTRQLLSIVQRKTDPTAFFHSVNNGDAAPLLKALLNGLCDRQFPPGASPATTEEIAQYLQMESQRHQQFALWLKNQHPTTYEAIVSVLSDAMVCSKITRANTALSTAFPAGWAIWSLYQEG